MKKAKYSIWQNVKYIYSKMWQYSRSLVLYSFARMPINVVLPFLGIYLSSFVVGAVTNKYTPGQIIISISIIMLATLVLNLISLFLSGKIQGLSLGNRVNFLKMIAEKSLSTDYENLESPSGQVKLSKAMECINSNNSSGEAVVYSLIDVASSLIGIVSYATLIITINPIIIGVVIVSAFINFLLLKRRNRWEIENRDNYTPIERKLNYILNCSRDFSSAKDIKIYNMSGWVGGLFTDFLNQRIYWIKKSESQGFRIDALSGILTLIRDAICFGWLVYLLFVNGLSADQFILYFGVIAGFSNWIYGFADKWAALDNHSIKICDLRDYLEMEDKFNYGKGLPMPTDDFSIEFKNVSFRYSGSETNAIDNINLKIKNGEKIAFVGANGAGKTTLVKMLCGFYKTIDGEILVGGNNIFKYNINEYYQNICAVFQDMNFLPVSINDNITFGRKKNTANYEINDLIEMVGLKSKIDSLPQGKDTCLGRTLSEDAIDLSGGEKQKLALARALYQGGNILVLDEPTAALDPIAENEMYLKYNEMAGGKTTIFVSHRLASTKFCDRIVMLDKGKIIEMGTHDELIQNGGKYAEMFEMQSYYYKREGSKNVLQTEK